jgi:hypothetical protein
MARTRLPISARMRSETASLSGQAQAFMAAKKEGEEGMISEDAELQCGPACAVLHSTRQWACRVSGFGWGSITLL